MKMKKTRGFLFLLLAAVLLLTSVPMSFAAGSDAIADIPPEPFYADVPDDAWYTPALEWNTNLELMIGTGTDDAGNAYFEPQTELTREAAASLAMRLSHGEAAEVEATFPDVGQDQWFSQPINWCTENGIVSDTRTATTVSASPSHASS